MALPQERMYTIDDIYNLPEGQRAELIDGQIYYMGAPNRKHQDIIRELLVSIDSYIKSKKGPCRVYPAPFAVFLNKDENYVEPDISVICDSDKLNDKGCNGAPDWIIEITSPGNFGHDYITKLAIYKSAGVKEYWIVNPTKKTVTVYSFLEEEFTLRTYFFQDKIKVNIYDDFEIDFNELNI